MNAALAALLRDRRMVLCLPCGAGELLGEVARCAPAVGLDPDPVAVQRCRDAGLVAWPGDCRALAAHRQKFDAILAAGPDAGTRAAEGLATLAASLLPGGLLLADEAVTTAPPGLEPRPGPPGLQVFARPRRIAPPPTQPAPVALGGLADFFVGGAPVLDVGSGQGRFLDALHVRDLAAVGVEPEPTRAAALRAHGHQVLADLPALLARPQAFAGIHLGHAVDGFDDRQLTVLLAACRHALQPHGRLLLHGARHRDLAGRAATLLRPAGFRTAGLSALPGVDEPLLAAVVDPSQPLPPLPATAALAALPLATDALPADRPLRSRFDLDRYERRVHSQGGEDGVLAALFALLGTTNRQYVEFGCGDGVQCNTAALRRQGWRGLIMDGVASPGAPDADIVAAWITRENIEALFDQHGVPAEPDLMSIDLDGNDYWVWQAIRRRPRVIVAEYNANLGPDEALTIPYDAAHQWNGTDFYGASLRALEQLGRAKGYTLVYCNHAGVNAFFVRDDLMGGEARRPVAELYKPPNYWYRGARQVPDLGRRMQSV